MPPQWGWGRLFGTSAGFFFTKTALIWKRKVKKSIRRRQIDRLAEGYKPTIDIIQGPLAKKRIFGPKSDSIPKPCSSQAWAKLNKEKLTFSQINISLLTNFRCLLRTNGFSACGYQNFCSLPKLFPSPNMLSWAHIGHLVPCWLVDWWLWCAGSISLEILSVSQTLFLLQILECATFEWRMR